MFWDYWEKYKFHMVSGAIIVITLGLWLGFILSGQTRVRDITLMSELKSFASGLESYRSQHAAYPEGSLVDLRQAVVVNDSGLTHLNPPLAQGGSIDGGRGGSTVVYYQGKVAAGKAVYSSAGQGYEISFRLQRQWPIVGATKKNCVIRENYQISCS